MISPDLDVKMARKLATLPEPMVFATGALNASMHRAGNIPVSLTFVTGMLVRFDHGLGNFLIRRLTGWNWLAQASSWVGLIAGATIGGAVDVRIGAAAPWVPIALWSFLAAGSAVMRQPD